MLWRVVAVSLLMGLMAVGPSGGSVPLDLPDGDEVGLTEASPIQPVRRVIRQGGMLADGLDDVLADALPLVDAVHGPQDLLFPGDHIDECLELRPDGHNIRAYGGGPIADQPMLTLRLAVAADASFVATHGAGWKPAAQAYINQVSDFYEDQVRIQIQVVDKVSIPDGAFSNTGDGSTILSDLRAWYGANKPGLQRDAVLMLWGKDVAGTVAGQANCLGSIGDVAESFAWAEAGGDEGTPFLGTTAFADQTAKVVAHEIAHLFSAHHHYSNCVEGTAFAWGTDDFLAYCTLMINDIGLASLEFSEVNRLAVRGWAEYAGLS